MFTNIKNIRKKNFHVIAPSCRESFLPINAAPLDLLRKRQVGFSGISLLKNRYEIKRATYPSHLLLYTLAGSGWVRIGEDTIYTKPNQVWICPAGHPHHYGLNSKQWKIIWFGLKEGSEWSAVEEIGSCIRESVSAQMLEHSAAAIIEEFKADRPDSDRAIELNSRLIILHLQRELSMESDPRGKEVLDKLNRLFEQVEERPSFNWTIDGLSKQSQIHVCPVHFSRLCRKHMGQTPMQIVKKKRLEKAKDLLVHTDYSLELISEIVGYQTPFSLSTAFKKHYDISPRQYRNAHG